MVEKKAAISLEISKVPIILVRLESVGQSFGKGHCLGGLTNDTDVVKVYGMVQFVLEGHHHNGISRHFFIDGDVDAQEKPHNDGTDQYYR